MQGIKQACTLPPPGCCCWLYPFPS